MAKLDKEALAYLDEIIREQEDYYGTIVYDAIIECAEYQAQIEESKVGDYDHA